MIWTQDIFRCGRRTASISFRRRRNRQANRFVYDTKSATASAHDAVHRVRVKFPSLGEQRHRLENGGSFIAALNSEKAEKSSSRSETFGHRPQRMKDVSKETTSDIAPD